MPQYRVNINNTTSENGNFHQLVYFHLKTTKKITQYFISHFTKKFKKKNLVNYFRKKMKIGVLKQKIKKVIKPQNISILGLSQKKVLLFLPNFVSENIFFIFS